MFTANAGVPKGAGIRVAVEVAARATAEVRAVPHQRAAPADFADGPASVGRAALGDAERHKHILRRAGSHRRSFGQRSDLLVSRREDPPR